MSDTAAGTDDERQRGLRRRFGFLLTDAALSVTRGSVEFAPVRRVGQPVRRSDDGVARHAETECGDVPSPCQSDSGVVCVRRSKSAVHTCRFLSDRDVVYSRGAVSEETSASFVSPDFVGRRSASLLRGRRSSSSSSSGELKNPFDEHILSLIGRPFVNPAIFDEVVSPSDEVSESWTVEQLSELFPADIDVSRAVGDDTDLSDPKERIYQSRIDRYFEEFHAIVTPSPETKSAGVDAPGSATPGGSVTTRPRKVACEAQTSISIPPKDLSPCRVELLNRSKPVGCEEEFFESVGEACGRGSANTTLDDSCVSMTSVASCNPRRKLFAANGWQCSLEEPSCLEEDEEGGGAPLGNSTFNGDMSFSNDLDASMILRSVDTDADAVSPDRLDDGRHQVSASLRARRGRDGTKTNLHSTMLEAPFSGSRSISAWSSRFSDLGDVSVLLGDDAAAAAASSSVVRSGRGRVRGCGYEDDDENDGSVEEGLKWLGSGTRRLFCLVEDAATPGSPAKSPRRGQGEGTPVTGSNFLSSVHLEETRAEFFSDSAESVESLCERNATPVVAREKSILRYATVLERHVGTQTDLTWPVENIPSEIEQALMDFRLEDTVDRLEDSMSELPKDAPPASWKTPMQPWLPKGFLLRSSSPKSFERNKREGSAVADMESSPNFVIVKDTECGPSAAEGDSGGFAMPRTWRLVSPGSLDVQKIDREAVCSRGFFDNDNFEKEFRTPRKRGSGAAFSTGEPDLSPIGLSDDGEASCAVDPVDPERGEVDVDAPTRGDFVRTGSHGRHGGVPAERRRRSGVANFVDLRAQWDKENVFSRKNSVGSIRSTLSQTEAGAESFLGGDDTGYHSYQPSSSSTMRSFQSQSQSSASALLSFAAVANSTTACPNLGAGDGGARPPSRSSSLASFAAPPTSSGAPRPRPRGELDEAGAASARPMFARSSSMVEPCSSFVPRRRSSATAAAAKALPLQTIFDPDRRSVDDLVLSRDASSSSLSGASRRSSHRVLRRLSALGCESAASSSSGFAPYVGESKRHWWRSSSRKPSLSAVDSWRSQPSVLSDRSDESGLLDDLSRSSSLAGLSDGGGAGSGAHIGHRDENRLVEELSAAELLR